MGEKKKGGCGFPLFFALLCVLTLVYCLDSPGDGGLLLEGLGPGVVVLDALVECLGVLLEGLDCFLLELLEFLVGLEGFLREARLDDLVAELGQLLLGGRGWLRILLLLLIGRVFLILRAFLIGLVLIGLVLIGCGESLIVRLLCGFCLSLFGQGRDEVNAVEGAILLGHRGQVIVMPVVAPLSLELVALGEAGLGAFEVIAFDDFRPPELALGEEVLVVDVVGRVAKVFLLICLLLADGERVLGGDDFASVGNRWDGSPGLGAFQLLELLVTRLLLCGSLATTARRSLLLSSLNGLVNVRVVLGRFRPRLHHGFAARFHRDGIEQLNVLLRLLVPFLAVINTGEEVEEVVRGDILDQKVVLHLLKGIRHVHGHFERMNVGMGCKSELVSFGLLVSILYIRVLLI